VRIWILMRIVSTCHPFLCKCVCNFGSCCFSLAATAVQAFADLGESLPETAQNAQLIAAIRRLAEKRKG
jgi:hypothetical protein